MNPTGLLVPTVVAVSRALPSVPSVRCSSTRAPLPACTSAGNAADVTTARLERSLRLGTCWQEGKRSVPQATWFLPLLLFAPLLLALCAVLHVFLDGWTEWPLPNWRVGRRTLLVVSVLSLPRNFSSKQTHRTELSMCYTTCKKFARK